MTIIQLPATVERIATRKDMSMTISFSTQELAPSSAMDLFALQNQLVYLGIKNIPLVKEELDYMEKLKLDVSDMGKTPSERLRATIFLNWKQNNKGYTDFNLFYQFEMEGVINVFKKLLPPV